MMVETMDRLNAAAYRCKQARELLEGIIFDLNTRNLERVSYCFETFVSELQALEDGLLGIRDICIDEIKKVEISNGKVTAT